MKRAVTDGDRAYALWALRRGMALAEGIADRMVMQCAEEQAALLERGEVAHLEQALQKLFKHMQALVWNVPHDRELMALSFGAIAVGCGAASTDRGLIEPLRSMSRMNARASKRTELISQPSNRDPGEAIAMAANEAETEVLRELSRQRIATGAFAEQGGGNAATK